MNRRSFSIHFYIKRTKRLKNGNSPIFCRISINGSRAEFSCLLDINQTLWDSNRNRVKRNAKSAAQVNEELSAIERRIHTIKQYLFESNSEISAKNIVHEFKGKTKPALNLVEWFDEHNNRIQNLIGNGYCKSTYGKYVTTRNHIKEFISSNQKVEGTLKSIDPRFISLFEHYLKASIGCQHNSAMKHIRALKKVIREALKFKLIESNPFDSYKIKIQAKAREFLSLDELKRIMHKDFQLPRLEIIKDAFVLQCFTGLAYTDLARLKRSNLHIGIDGQKWIYLIRQKTGVPCRIPLLAQAEVIIAKYEDQIVLTDKLIPISSNQKMNAYLKEVAVICGIEKNLTTHMARHTFATTIALNNGIPIETVSALLGHRKISTTKIYAKVLECKIADDMNLLRSKIAL